jgi:hypothetical protein
MPVCWPPVREAADEPQRRSHLASTWRQSDDVRATHSVQRVRGRVEGQQVSQLPVLDGVLHTYKHAPARANENNTDSLLRLQRAELCVESSTLDSHGLVGCRWADPDGNVRARDDTTRHGAAHRTPHPCARNGLLRGSCMSLSSCRGCHVRTPYVVLARAGCRLASSPLSGPCGCGAGNRGKMRQKS